MNTQAVIPLRGVRFRDDGSGMDPFSRDWSVLSLKQMGHLAVGYGHESSFASNVRMLIKRLDPDAFLLVAIDGPELPDPVRRIGEKANPILGALCLTALLTPEHGADRRQYSPRPIFWAKFSELCELPLVADKTNVRVAGHTGLLAWLSPDDGGAGGYSLGYVSDLMKGVGRLPSSARALLDGTPLQQWQRPFAAILETLPACFLVGSAAQCVANLVSFAEVCVTSIREEKWTKRLNRLKVVAGLKYWSRVHDVIEARHDHVHRGKNCSDTVAFSALALAVQVFCVVHEIAESVGGLEPAIKYCDGHTGVGFPSAKRTTELTTGEVRVLSKRLEDIPNGPGKSLWWLRHGLTDVPWNDFTG